MYPPFSSSFDISPQMLEMMLVKAVEHHRADRLAEAETLYRSILAQNPREPDASHNLGRILFQDGRAAESIPLLKVAIEVSPQNGQYWLSLAEGLLLAGLAEAAAMVLDTARGRGLAGEAVETLAARIRERVEGGGAQGGAALPEAERSRLEALLAAGRYNEGEEVARRLADLYPDDPLPWKGLGLILAKVGRAGDAVSPLRRAVSLAPDDPEAHAYLGSALDSVFQAEEAVVHLARALDLRPDYAEAHNNLGNALKGLGRIGEALARYAAALDCAPSSGPIYSNLLFLEGLACPQGSAAYLARARGWERACVPEAERAAAARVAPIRSRSGRRLRIGYLSGDYRIHPVSCFIEQLFLMHDRDRVELVAVSAHPARDEVTARIQSQADRWISVAGLSDGAVVERIAAEAVDVLVDLSGHTAYNRMGVIARRAAPVQAHYLGFFASTGLSEMDYWIGDDILTPPEQDGDFSERVWRLPRPWVSYAPPMAAPDPDWRPRSDGQVWVGGFNNLGKITDATLALWARLLHALPEGRLLIKAKELASAANRDRIVARLAALGIGGDRVVLQDTGTTRDWRDHMAQYDRLDIALDPVGAMGGGTTTCDALWMGVPVVTLAGTRMATRMSASLVAAIGRREWIADSEDAYVATAVALARDVALRRAARAEQRRRMAASPLCDAKGLARALEEAYEAMFDRRRGEPK